MLQGKCAIVTGSTSGIGLGIARALAGEGADLVVNGFAEADAVAEIRSAIEGDFGVRCVYHGADMAKPDEVAALVAEATSAFGKVDILVNNAGIQHTAPVEDFPPDRWDAIIAVNLSALFHAVRAVLPQMKARNWGRIINISSAHGLVASIHKVAYVAAKHGVIGLTKVVAMETAETGITCNAICPGWVRTPLAEWQIKALAEARGITFDEAVREMLAPRQPSKQFVTTEQIGKLAVFLCSDGADQMTGTSLPIDGGFVAH